eukprot:6174668-Pleurochrysis_carterae.AAC.1
MHNPQYSPSNQNPTQRERICPTCVIDALNKSEFVEGRIGRQNGLSELPAEIRAYIGGFLLRDSDDTSYANYLSSCKDVRQIMLNNMVTLCPRTRASAVMNKARQTLTFEHRPSVTTTKLLFSLLGPTLKQQADGIRTGKAHVETWTHVETMICATPEQAIVCNFLGMYGYVSHKELVLRLAGIPLPWDRHCVKDAAEKAFNNMDEAHHPSHCSCKALTTQLCADKVLQDALAKA